MNRDTLKYVLSDQRQEAAALLSGAILRRRPHGADERPGRRQATVITGVRRCGKSVYAHQLCGEGAYVSLDFDDERLAAFGTSDFDMFLQAANELEGTGDARARVGGAAPGREPQGLSRTSCPHPR